MTIVKTRIKQALNNNRFRVTVSWEHGDADLTTYHTSQFSGMSDEGLLTWVQLFRRMADTIDNDRSCGIESFEREDWSDLGLDILYDKIYDSSNTPPNATIDKVEWVDDEGIVYSVTGY